MPGARAKLSILSSPQSAIKAPSWCPPNSRNAPSMSVQLTPRAQCPSNERQTFFSANDELSPSARQAHVKRTPRTRRAHVERAHNKRTPSALATGARQTNAKGPPGARHQSSRPEHVTRAPSSPSARRPRAQSKPSELKAPSSHAQHTTSSRPPGERRAHV